MKYTRRWLRLLTASLILVACSGLHPGATVRPTLRPGRQKIRPAPNELLDATPLQKVLFGHPFGTLFLSLAARGAITAAGRVPQYMLVRVILPALRRMELYVIAMELKGEGKYDIKAERLYRLALEKQRETLGNRHPSTLNSINNLGLLLEAKGDLAAAEQLLCEALEARRETLGNRHPSTLKSINNLGLLLEAKGDLAASEQLQCEALEARRETLGK